MLMTRNSAFRTTSINEGSTSEHLSTTTGTCRVERKYTKSDWKEANSGARIWMVGVKSDSKGKQYSYSCTEGGPRGVNREYR